MMYIIEQKCVIGYIGNIDRANRIVYLAIETKRSATCKNMKITIKREDLLDVLAIAKQVATNDRTTILSCVLFKTGNAANTLRVHARGNGVDYTALLRASVNGDGQWAVNADLLWKWVHNISGTDITVSGSDIAHFKCDRFSIDLINQQHAYPDISPADPGHSHSAADKLRQGISYVLLHTGRDKNARQTLNSLYMTMSDNELVLAGTDSFRLAERRIPITSADADTGQPTLLPFTAAKLLSGLLHDGNVSVALLGKTAVFGLPLTTPNMLTAIVSIQAIDDKYPNYKTFIPAPASLATQARVSGPDLLRMTKHALLFTTADNNYKIHYHLAANEITLAAASATSGTTSCALEASVTGPTIEFMTNGTFIADALTGMRGDVVVAANAPDKPIAIWPANGEKSIAVIMPIWQEKT